MTVHLDDSDKSAEHRTIDRISLLLDQGQSFLAQDLAQEALRVHPESWRLRHLQALALAQAGATEEARNLIEPLVRIVVETPSEVTKACAALRESLSTLPLNPVPAGPPQADTSGIAEVFRALRRLEESLGDQATAYEEPIALLARLHKDAWRTSGRHDDLQQSRDLYLKAFQLTRKSFSGINAASLSWILGDRPLAKDLAEQVLAICAIEFETERQDDSDAYWLLATRGEASLLLGNADQATEAYAEATSRVGQKYRLAMASRRQLLALQEHGLSIPRTILQTLTPPTVVLFTGHMIDKQDRRVPRFPESLEGAVKDEIDRILSELDAKIGYSSAACGGDLLFIEAMHARRAEIHVVLPFHVDDFIETSVRFAGPGWEARFREAIAGATVVAHAMKDRYLGEVGLFQFCNKVLAGLSRFHARQLSAEIQLVALLDEQGESDTGGTEALVSQWPSAKSIKVIDLSVLRRTSSHAARPAQKRKRVSFATDFSSGPATITDSRSLHREIRSMLFADLKNFTKVEDQDVPAFLQFLGEIAKGLKGVELSPEYVRTTGDGIFAVMERATSMTNYAFALKHAVRRANDTVGTLQESLQVRIALHAAPVYRVTDPLTGRPAYFGSHVNRAARLEPVTIPGHIYATEQFVALLETEAWSRQGGNELPWICEYLGKLQLAKNFDNQRAYHLRERHKVTLGRVAGGG